MMTSEALGPNLFTKQLLQSSWKFSLTVVRVGGSENVWGLAQSGDLRGLEICGTLFWTVIHSAITR